MKEFFQEVFIPTILTLSSVIAISLLLLYVTIKVDCSNYSKMTGRETKVSVLNCYVKNQDQWYTLDEYKYMEIK